ncbi:MAG: hypothetical protein H6Q90_4213, partial [Deltaproteobacteria bacterium]|nr:hypothetical protein [Deltaproteobacteria bacterium]
QQLGIVLADEVARTEQIVVATWCEHLLWQLGWAGIGDEHPLRQQILETVKETLASHKLTTSEIALSPPSESCALIAEDWRIAAEVHGIWDWVDAECGGDVWTLFWHQVREALPAPPEELDALSDLSAHARRDGADPTWPLVATGATERAAVRATLDGIRERMGVSRLPEWTMDPESVPDRPELETAPGVSAATNAAYTAHRWLVVRARWSRFFHFLAPYLRPPA